MYSNFDELCLGNSFWTLVHVLLGKAKVLLQMYINEWLLKMISS